MNEDLSNADSSPRSEVWVSINGLSLMYILYLCIHTILSQMINNQILASNLLETGAVRIQPDNPFTWASGMRSPIYCDNRVLLSYPAIRTNLVDLMVKVIKDFEFFDTVAGVATAGIPVGTLLADRLKLPFAYVRAKPKEHGRQNLIEGDIKKCKSISGRRPYLHWNEQSSGSGCCPASAGYGCRGCRHLSVWPS